MLVSSLALLGAWPRPTLAAGAEGTPGLVALYDFQEFNGGIIKDRSDAGEPLNLRAANASAVRWSKGALEITGATLIASEQPARKITDAVRASGELSIEAWLRPARAEQSGPARIVTLSKNGNERNFTLGQDGGRYDVRLRTTGTSVNGMPSLASADRRAATAQTHLVYTRNRAGQARLYVNGKLDREQTVPGELKNWDREFRLGLANELSHDRPWLGTLHRVAVYSRALAAEEVTRHFQAGPQGAVELTAEEKAARALAAKQAENAQFFDAEVAGLLAKRCFECHDSATRKGKLDLSRRAAALSPRKGGKTIVAGRSSESLLWQSVEANEMPADRPPLSDREKAVLRQWIEGGAVWTTEVIDPATYAHTSRGGQAFVRRLTAPEYIETVRAATGVDIAEDARRLLPADTRADGFNNTAYNLTVDLAHIEAYARLAESIVQRLDAPAFAARFEKSRSLADDKTMRALVEKMGRRLLRGPLAEHEILGLRGILTDVNGASGTYEEGVRRLLEAMLQSPRFIYQMEQQRGDGTLRPADPHDMASRLSYMLWGGPPDQELARAADTGELRERRHVEAQVARMLKDPRVVTRSLQFAEQWLNLGRLGNLRPNPAMFPQWNPQLAADMREETREFFREVVWAQKRPLAEVLNAQVTFATPELAKLYGLPPVTPPPGTRLARYDLSSVPGRGGLLTQGSVLTVGGDEASMVTRGLFVLHDLLRGVVTDPPPCVNTTPVPAKPGLSKRAIAERRVANTQCGGCHAKFEPLAYGLERFDGIGAYHRRDEHGNALREDGEILFPGAEKSVAYRSSAELMNVLAASERVRETLTWKVAQFALGRPPGPADAPELEKIHRAAHAAGGTYESLIRAIVLSDLVLTTRTEAN